MSRPGRRLFRPTPTLPLPVDERIASLVRDAFTFALLGFDRNSAHHLRQSGLCLAEARARRHARLAALPAARCEDQEACNGR
jgi:hypothetical protein